MGLGNHLSFFAALVRINVRSTVALRGAFILQSVLMMVNNFIFFSVWLVLMANYDEIRGWRLTDVSALYGFAALVFGLCVVLFGGALNLARMIAEGELDPFLTQPQPMLIQAAASYSLGSAWGDIVSGIVLIALSGHVGWTNVALIPFLACMGTLTFLASIVTISSLAFWIGSMDTLARQLIESLVTFMLYPQSLFSGGLRLLLYTVIPAGFITYLPVELIRSFSWGKAALALLGSVIYWVFALTVFSRGMKRYQSGNRLMLRS